ncbi:hypothetical protein ACX3VT_00800 [Aerococcus sanguinicola]|uniref:hypothetical protein n=1 Tax=unclassified Aerococcus TaxID=2618060 RepID=UPI001FEF7185|nr:MULTISPECIES: hypothetical protein [unclassified Aerococcus]MDK6234063.1 hypothetical protein [Aerococcus sp. UMB10185]MDK6856606.1 hypothetical protein [Aerococcus sp. UMB7533]MDK8503097.1 hypothetical protein [Aerococcus sp. UMB1112A]
MIPIPGSKNQDRILVNLAPAKIHFTPEEFETLNEAIDRFKIHGHRGHVESEQASFGRN